MPTETLTLNAPGDQEQIDFGSSGPNNHWRDCDAQDALYVQNVTLLAVWLRDLYNCDASGVGVGTINKVTIYMRVKKLSAVGGTSYAQEYIKSGGVAAGAPSHALSTAYQTFNNDWVTPPEGGSWTWAKINALQIGVGLNSYWSGKLSEYAMCDRVWAVVDFNLVQDHRHGFVNFQVPGIV